VRLFEGVAWHTIGLPDLARLQALLGDEPDRTRPLPARRDGETPILTAVCEFLRFCARTGLVQSVVGRAVVRTALAQVHTARIRRGRVGPVRAGAGRDCWKARAETPFPDALTPEQSKAVFFAPAGVPVSASWSSCCTTQVYGSVRRSGYAARTCTCLPDSAQPSGAPSSGHTCTCGAG